MVGTRGRTAATNAAATTAPPPQPHRRVADDPFVVGHWVARRGDAVVLTKDQAEAVAKETQIEEIREFHRRVVQAGRVEMAVVSGGGGGGGDGGAPGSTEAPPGFTPRAMLRAVCQPGGSLRWPALAKLRALPLVRRKRWSTTGALVLERAQIVDHRVWATRGGRHQKYKVLHAKGVEARWGVPRKSDADGSGGANVAWLTAEDLRASSAGTKLIEEYHNADAAELTRTRKRGQTRC
jgi:hypothetical protein